MTPWQHPHESAPKPPDQHAPEPPVPVDAKPTVVVASVEVFVAAGPQWVACGHELDRGGRLVEVRVDGRRGAWMMCEPCWRGLGARYTLVSRDSGVS